MGGEERVAALFPCANRWQASVVVFSTRRMRLATPARGGGRPKCGDTSAGAQRTRSLTRSTHLGARHGVPHLLQNFDVRHRGVVGGVVWEKKSFFVQRRTKRREKSGEKRKTARVEKTHARAKNKRRRLPCPVALPARLRVALCPPSHTQSGRVPQNARPDGGRPAAASAAGRPSRAATTPAAATSCHQPTVDVDCGRGDGTNHRQSTAPPTRQHAAAVAAVGGRVWRAQAR